MHDVYLLIFIVEQNLVEIDYYYYYYYAVFNAPYVCQSMTKSQAR